MARFNVKDAPYNAPGDAVRLLDGVVASGSDVVTSATANFQAGAAPAGDVGKIIWATDATGIGVVLARTTIIARISATQVQVGRTATANLSGACVVFGTAGDQAAAGAVFAAAVAAYRGGSVAGMFEFPSGGYIFSSRWYRNNGTVLNVAGPDVVGDGKNNTQFYLTPDFTVPGDGSTLFMEGIGFGASWRGFMIDGCYATLASANAQPLVRIAQAQSFSVSDVHVRNIGLGAGSYMFQTDGCRQFHINNVTGQNLGIIGGGGAMLVEDCQGVFTQCFASNTATNLRFVNCKDRSTLTTPLTWIGGGSDEGGSPAVALTNADVNIIGAVNFGGIDPPSVAFDVDGTSCLYIANSNVGRFQGYAGQSRPLNNRAGGLVVSYATTWRGNATPPGSPLAFMQNAGRFIDTGGNDFRRYSADDVYTLAIPTTADCFSGNNPIVNGSFSAYNQRPY